MATLFHQKPSDLALLDDSVDEIGKSWFNSGVAAFGLGVHAAVERAGTSNDPSIVQAQRTREWERIMGGDGASAFREVGSSVSGRARVHGRDDDEDDFTDDGFDVDGGYW